MYKGNGFCKTFPLPNGATGEAITFALEGRCAVLKKGEGYDIVNGNIEFNEAPPEGAVINVGSQAGRFTSEEAVMMIVEGMAQMTALMESARIFVSQVSASIGKTADDAKKNIQLALDSAIKKQSDEFTKTFVSKVKEAEEAFKEATDSIAKMAEDIAFDVNQCKSLAKETERKNAEITLAISKAIADITDTAEAQLKEIRDVGSANVENIISNGANERVLIKQEADSSLRYLTEAKDAVSSSAAAASDKLAAIESSIERLRSGAGRISRKLEV